MKTKQLLLLILVLVAGIFLLQRTGSLRGGDDPGRDPEAPTQADGADGAAATDPTLTAPGVDAAAAPANRSVIGESRLPGGLIPAAQDGPQRAIKVTVLWPDAARPQGVVEACIFQDDIQGAAVLRALTTSYVRPSTKSRVFDGLRAAAREPSAIRARALAVAPLTPNNLGRWTATLQVPKRAGRVFAHVVGATYYTPQAAIADLETADVIARPVRGGKLRLRATTTNPEIRLAGLPFTVSESQSPESSQGSEINRFRLDGTLDASGEAVLLTVPSDLPIKVSVFPEDSAMGTVEVPAITPGTAGTATLKLSAGATIKGHVVDPSGAPIGGATVTTSVPGRAFGIDDDVIRSVQSRRDGSFEIVGLPAGELIARASAGGWLETERSRFTLEEGKALTDVEFALSDGGTLTGKALLPDGTPAAGAQLEATFDLGHMMGPSALNITRGAVGSGAVDTDGRFAVAGLGRGPFALTCEWLAPDGTVYSARLNGLPPGSPPVELRLTESLALSGILVDIEGRPLGGLEVQCARLLNGSMGDVRINKQKATSDEGGHFRFEVDQDRFELAVAEDDYVSLERRVIQTDDARDGLRIVCAQAVTASGVVLGPDGSPVAGADVTLETGASAIQSQAGVGERSPSTRTDKDGTFKLLGIQPGEVILNAEMDKLARASTEAIGTSPGETLTGIVLQLNRGGAVEGLCFDNDGRTAAGRIVSVTSLTKNVNRNALSDRDGTFRVEGLTPGTYQVVALDPNMQSTGNLDASALAEMWKYMKLATADVVDGETAFVFLGAPPSDPVDVEGSVTQGGEPFSGGLMTWLPASEGMKERMQTAEVDKDGRYRARLNQAGPYIVNVQRVPGAGVQQQTVEFSIQIPDGTQKLTRDFVVPGGGVTGQVRNVDGSPAVAVRIAVSGVGGIPTNRLIGGSYAEIQTDTKGRYTVTGLRPGNYQISAGGATFLGTTNSAPARVTVGPVKVDKDEIRGEVDLQLTEPGTVHVTVLDSTGAGVPGASVFLLDDKGRHSETFSVLSTGQGGTVRMNSVSPGTYTLAARTGKRASQESLPVDVRAGETSTLELTLEPGTLIEASVKYDGRTLSNASIQIIDAEGRDLTRRLGMVDSQAIYQGNVFSFESSLFGPFPPGSYVVKATSPEGKSGTRRVRLKGTKPKRKVMVKLK